MNVPSIRKALEQLDRSFMAFQHHGAPHPVTAAVVRVGLRACDQLEQCSEKCREDRDGAFCFECVCADYGIGVIADILREAGVEVKE